MNWNLNCRRTRRLLALSADNDFEERQTPETQRHLAICPHCRAAWRGLRQSQQVLEQVRAAPVEDQDPAVSGRSQGLEWPPSIWLGVARHLRVIDEQSSAPNWRGWLPAGALAAACLAVVLVTIPDPRFGMRTVENRQPLVIYPQHASAGSRARDFQLRPGTTLPESDRDLPEGGVERPVQFLQGDDEPRSF